MCKLVFGAENCFVHLIFNIKQKQGEIVRVNTKHKQVFEYLKLLCFKIIISCKLGLLNLKVLHVKTKERPNVVS